VVWGQSLEVARGGGRHMVRGDAPSSPVGTYALTKALAEGVAWYYAQTRPYTRRRTAVEHPLEAITLRIAAPLDLDDPDLRRRPVRPQQVPLPDLAQAFARALTVRLRGYEVVTIVGDSSRRLWDLKPAQRVLGYRPSYYLDDLGVAFADPFAVAEE